ncbi:MAG: response regulator, partial [Opitutaceae bacterium]
PGHTILLVEDDPDDVFLMQRALKQAHVANPLQFATDGQQAQDYLSGTGPYQDRIKHPLPDLVFLDLKLPFIHGFEVLAWVRDHPELGRIPVVILTSSPEERDIQQARRLGARSFLVKPPSAQMLSDLMKSLTHDQPVEFTGPGGKPQR